MPINGFMPYKTFDGVIGKTSVGIMGPDKLEEDINILCNMFNPIALMPDGKKGGISSNHFQPGAVDDVAIGDLVPSMYVVPPAFNGSGKLSIILGAVAKVLKAITGEDWYKTPVDSIKNLDLRIKDVVADILEVATSLETHRTSTDHNDKYFTKQEMLPYLTPADTKINEEIFTIINPDLGDGTFSYKDINDNILIGTLTPQGYQVFTLQDGTYPLNENRIEVTINDVLRRSVKSGGLIEIDTSHFALAMPEAEGMEITARYYENVKIAGMHGLSHEPGGSDEVKGVIEVLPAAPVNPYQYKVFIRLS